MLASYSLPADMTVSGTYQVSSGPIITATWNAPNSDHLPGASKKSLRPGATATKSVQLIEPGTLCDSYQNQLDLRFSKRMRIGR